jgi:CRP/FNR family cyclic AMP-dependent transcriptional regulator
MLYRIEARSRLADLRGGARILAQDDPADAVYAIIGGPGRVRIGAVGRDSKGLMVELLGPGDIFGEIGVIDGSVRTADAFADGNVPLLRTSAPVFTETLAEHAALGRDLCAMLATRLRRTFALFQDATFEGLEVRLARQVLYLAGRGGRRSEHGLRLAGGLVQNWGCQCMPDIFAPVLGTGVGRGVDFEGGGSRGRGSLRGHHGDQQA